MKKSRMERLLIKQRRQSEMCGKICQAIEASFFTLKNTNNNNNNKLPASESCTKQTLEKIKKKNKKKKH